MAAAKCVRSLSAKAGVSSCSPTNSNKSALADSILLSSFRTFSGNERFSPQPTQELRENNSSLDLSVFTEVRRTPLAVRTRPGGPAQAKASGWDLWYTDGADSQSRLSTSWFPGTTWTLSSLQMAGSEICRALFRYSTHSLYPERSPLEVRSPQIKIE